MSKKFYAMNRVTGEKWKPKGPLHQYLVMYDSGYLAVVSEDYYSYISPLNPAEWEVVHKIKQKEK